jgi:tetratricopeptide (TPR) repeat protein
MPSLAEESALLTELRELSERGQHQQVAERLASLTAEFVQAHAPFALLAAEAHGRVGRYDEAARWAVAALAAARSSGDRSAELRATHFQSAVALERGDLAAAEQLLGSALRLGREVGDRAAEARCFNNLGIIAFLRGDPQDALTSYALALAAYQQVGSVRGMAEVHHNISISRRHLGDHNGALAAADEAVRLAGRLGDDRLAAQALAGRAEVHLASDLALAAAELEMAEAAYARMQNAVGLAEVWRLLGGVARGRGDAAAAVAHLERAAKLAREQGRAETIAEIERDLGAALAAVGDAAGARAARQRAQALYERLGAIKAAADLAALLAR